MPDTVKLPAIFKLDAPDVAEPDPVKSKTPVPDTVTFPATLTIAEPLPTLLELINESLPPETFMSLETFKLPPLPFEKTLNS